MLLCSTKGSERAGDPSETCTPSEVVCPACYGSAEKQVGNVFLIAFLSFPPSNRQCMGLLHLPPRLQGAQQAHLLPEDPLSLCLWHHYLSPCGPGCSSPAHGLHPSRHLHVRCHLALWRAWLSGGAIEHPWACHMGRVRLADC